MTILTRNLTRAFMRTKENSSPPPETTIPLAMVQMAQSQKLEEDQRKLPQSARIREHIGRGDNGLDQFPTFMDTAPFMVAILFFEGTALHLSRNSSRDAEGLQAMILKRHLLRWIVAVILLNKTKGDIFNN